MVAWGREASRGRETLWGDCVHDPGSSGDSQAWTYHIPHFKSGRLICVLDKAAGRSASNPRSWNSGFLVKSVNCQCDRHGNRDEGALDHSAASCFYRQSALNFFLGFKMINGL